jgi:hypothetical protein
MKKRVSCTIVRACLLKSGTASFGHCHVQVLILVCALPLGYSIAYCRLEASLTTRGSLGCTHDNIIIIGIVVVRSVVIALAVSLAEFQSCVGTVCCCSGKSGFSFTPRTYKYLVQDRLFLEALASAFVTSS